MEPKIQEKVWDPKIELEIRKNWEETGIYDFVIKDSNYTIDTPPPYPSGRPWHIGAASHYAQIDMIARTARMSGKMFTFRLVLTEMDYLLSFTLKKNMTYECVKLREENLLNYVKMH